MVMRTRCFICESPSKRLRTANDKAFDARSCGSLGVWSTLVILQEVRLMLIEGCCPGQSDRFAGFVVPRLQPSLESRFVCATSTHIRVLLGFDFEILDKLLVLFVVEIVSLPTSHRRVGAQSRRLDIRGSQRDVSLALRRDLSG